MRRLGHALSVTAATLLLGTALLAQEAPAGGDAAGPKPARELFTTGAGVTDAGVLVLNAGGQYSSYRDGSEARRYPAQVDLGVFSWLDLRAAWCGPTTIKDPQGVSRSGGADPFFGGQAQALRQEQAGLDLGLAYWHKMPRASVRKGMGTGKADDTLLLTATRTQGAWEFDGNAGAIWLGRQDATGTQRQGVVSCAVSRALGAGWNASLDTFALAATSDCARSVTSILAVTRDLTPNLSVDLGVESGLTRSAERFAVDAGVVWRVGRLWGKG